MDGGGDRLVMIDQKVKTTVKTKIVESYEGLEFSGLVKSNYIGTYIMLIKIQLFQTHRIFMSL